MTKEGDKQLQSEIEAMINLVSEAPGTEAPSTQAPGTDAPKTDAPGTDAPKTDAPSTDAPATKAPSTDAPATDAPATEAPTTAAPREDDKELERIRKENEDLRKKLADVSVPKTKAPRTAAPTTEAPLEDVEFVKPGEELEDMTPGVMNKLLNKVFKQGVEETRKRLGPKHDVGEVSGMVKESLEVILAMRAANETFYKDNKDLSKFKKVVGTVYGELAEQHPEWTIEKCLEETGKETRTRLELPAPKPGQKKEAKTGKDKRIKLPPGSRGSRRARGEPGKKTGMLAEIDQMNVEEQ